jgi:hypothetical protein
VIVRSGLVVTGGVKRDTGFYERISFPQIVDGSSNTLVIGEKFMQPRFYDTGAWDDDRGWTGGWDPDGLRSTACVITADEDWPDPSNIPQVLGYRFGSAHGTMMNAGFADASVRSISFTIDPETFNRLGHRSDEEELKLETL